MYKINKDEKAFKELTAYAESVNEPIKEVLVSDKHLDQVVNIFYKHLPKMVRIAMKLPKFKTFYQEHRQTLVANIEI